MPLHTMRLETDSRNTVVASNCMNGTTENYLATQVTTIHTGNCKLVLLMTLAERDSSADCFYAQIISTANGGLIHSYVASRRLFVQYQ